MATKKQPKKAAAKPKAESDAPDASEQSPDAKPRTCFIIMPFGGWFDSYYEKIYLPAVEGAGLKCRRADDLNRPSNIVNDIWEHTRGAELVLAELTTRNPNVFYELGLAHAIAKPAILIAQSMDDVPFDLKALRVITYDTSDPKWGEKLKARIQKAIGEVVEAPKKAVLATFLQESDQEDKPLTAGHQEKQLLAIQQEIESLRSEVANSNRPRINSNNSDEQLLFFAKRYIQKGHSPSDAAAILFEKYKISGQRATNIALKAAHIVKNPEKLDSVPGQLQYLGFPEDSDELDIDNASW